MMFSLGIFNHLLFQPSLLLIGFYKCKGFNIDCHVCCVRGSQIHCHRNYYTDTLEPTVKPAKVCYTEIIREQIKMWCNLAIGYKGKGVKHMRVNKSLGCSPPVVKSVSLRECLK